MIDDNMSYTRIITGDLENALAINSIILYTKKVIYNAMKKEQKPHIINVKYEVKNFIIKRNIDITLRVRKCSLRNNTTF